MGRRIAVAFDTETTGLTPYGDDPDRICSLAAVLVDRDTGEVIETGQADSWTFDPERGIAAGATAVNGFFRGEATLPDYARQDGDGWFLPPRKEGGVPKRLVDLEGRPTFADRADEILAVFERAKSLDPDFVVIGHNVAFDADFFAVELARAGRDIPFDLRCVDTRDLAMWAHHGLVRRHLQDDDERARQVAAAVAANGVPGIRGRFSNDLMGTDLRPWGYVANQTRFGKFTTGADDPYTVKGKTSQSNLNAACEVAGVDTSVRGGDGRDHGARPDALLAASLYMAYERAGRVKELAAAARRDGGILLVNLTKEFGFRRLPKKECIDGKWTETDEAFDNIVGVQFLGGRVDSDEAKFDQGLNSLCREREAQKAPGVPVVCLAMAERFLFDRPLARIHDMAAALPKREKENAVADLAREPLPSAKQSISRMNGVSDRR